MTAMLIKDDYLLRANSSCILVRCRASCPDVHAQPHGPPGKFSGGRTTIFSLFTGGPPRTGAASNVYRLAQLNTRCAGIRGHLTPVSWRCGESSPNFLVSSLPVPAASLSFGVFFCLFCFVERKNGFYRSNAQDRRKRACTSYCFP